MRAAQAAARSLHSAVVMQSTRLVISFVALAACSDSVPPEQTELETAQARWTAEAPTSYSFTWRRSCECSPDTTRPIRIDVMDGQISAALYLDDESTVGSEVFGTLLTIEGVFGRIEEAFEEGAHAIGVEYDATLGHPLSVSVDYDAQIADEELSLSISDLTPLAVP